MRFVEFAISKGSDQPAQTHSLIRAFRSSLVLVKGLSKGLLNHSVDVVKLDQFASFLVTFVFLNVNPIMQSPACADPEWGISSPP